MGEGHQEHHRGPGTMCLQHWSWGQLLKGKILLQEIEGQKVNTKTFIKSTPLQPSLCLNKYSKTTYCPNSFYLSFQKCYFFESRFIKNPRRQRESLLDVLTQKSSLMPTHQSLSLTICALVAYMAQSLSFRRSDNMGWETTKATHFSILHL